jgi:hypothetical protein
MMSFTIPPTRKKTTDVKDNYETADYNITDGITHEDDKINIEEYRHKGPTMHVVWQMANHTTIYSQTTKRPNTSPPNPT